MKYNIVKIPIAVMQTIYSIFKLLPVKRKVTFISRQSNSITLDFLLLYEEMKNYEPEIQQVVLTRKIEGGILSKIKYVFHMLVQMYHMATSKVVIVDGYCIAASVLNHKDDLTIIQIWHALSAVKCFGYQVLDKAEGSSSAIAKAMKMHNNYGCVSCASIKTAEYFSQAFNTPIEKFEIMGMPRVDYIHRVPDRNSEIREQYPEHSGKETILYIPTFRKNAPLDISEFKQLVDLKKYNLIIKAHPLDEANIDSVYLVDEKYSTYDLMKYADYIITDYSATAIEASILDVPLFFYVYDYDSYVENRGLNIDPFKEMPAATSKSLIDIIRTIDEGLYDFSELYNLRETYVETLDFSNTEKIVEKIIRLV